MIGSRALTTLALAVLVVPRALWARCPEPETLVDPARPPLPAAFIDTVHPGATVAEIFALLGPAQGAGSQSCVSPRRCVEWRFDDQRGLALEFTRFCGAPGTLRRETMHSLRQAEVAGRAGLWMVPRQQVEELNERARALGLPGNYGAPDAFYYDGRTLNVGLFPFLSEDAMNPTRPEDDIYRVATKWVGEDLYMLTPRSPHWSLQAHFRNGHFETEREPEKKDPGVITWRETADGQFEPVPDEPLKGLGVVIWRYERVPVDQAPSWAQTLASEHGMWNYYLGQESATKP